MAQEKFRVIIANTHPVIAKVPFEVPEIVKQLARTTDWEPLDGKIVDKLDAQTEKDCWGCLGTPQNRNAHVLDIEELFT